MSDDPLRNLELRPQPTKEELQLRVEQARRAQAAERTMRKSLRAIIIVGGGSGLAALFGAAVLESQCLGGLVCPLLLAALVSSVVLLFKGGFAPLHVRPYLTKEERRKLDE